MCSLVGPLGIDYLIQELIYERGILGELRATKSSLLEEVKGKENSGNKIHVAKVLTHGIRIGCLLAIRNQIWAAMNTGKYISVIRFKKKMLYTKLLVTIIPTEGTTY